MPHSLRFSKALAGKLGEEAGGELMDMLNIIELTQRTEFRELASRLSTLEGKLAQQTVELRSEFRAELREQLASLTVNVERRISAVESDLRDRMSGVEKRLIGWMFGFWIGTVATLLAILRA